MCKEDTASFRLDGSSKIVYMDHRRWLDKEDPWRQDKEKFDNTEGKLLVSRVGRKSMKC
jgi:hypothetical protein